MESDRSHEMVWHEPNIPRPPKAWIQTALQAFPLAVIQESKHQDDCIERFQPSIEVVLEQQGRRIFGPTN